jgi:hypothetical protein
LRSAMETAFCATGAEGAWVWKALTVLSAIPSGVTAEFAPHPYAVRFAPRSDSVLAQAMVT